MRLHWTTAALFSTALLVGCSDRGSDNAQNFNQNQQAPPADADQVNPPAPTAPAPSSSAEVDNSTARAERPDTSGARPTTGSRTTGGSRAVRPAPVPPTSATAEEHGGRLRDVTPGESRTVAPQVPAAPRVQWRELTVPANTPLALELLTPLSSETAQVETPVRARLRQSVTVDGYTAIPAGATLIGEVAEVERAGRVQGRSRLVMRFTEAQWNGNSESLRTNPLVFQGEATKGEDATKIGVGAGIGAAIGGIVGGGKGAAKGAAIGGAAGTGAVLATRGKDVELANGADLEATLASPIDIRVQIR
jgi:hypothetical protein